MRENTVKKVKTYISMALIGAMALSFTGCNMIKRTAASIGKTVLAEVDGTKITRADVDAELKSTLSQYKEQYGDDFEENSDLKDKLKSTRENVVDSLVEKEVLLKMAKKLDLVPEEDEINKYAEEQVQKYRDQVASSSTATETSTATVEEEFNKFTEQDAYLIFVTNEIGLGGVSPDAVQRRFTDLQGWLNQYIASRADEVVLMVSGIPMKVK